MMLLCYQTEREFWMPNCREFDNLDHPWICQEDLSMGPSDRSFLILTTLILRQFYNWRFPFSRFGDRGGGPGRDRGSGGGGWGDSSSSSGWGDTKSNNDDPWGSSSSSNKGGADDWDAPAPTTKRSSAPPPPSTSGGDDWDTPSTAAPSKPSTVEIDWDAALNSSSSAAKSEPKKTTSSKTTSDDWDNSGW